MCWDPNAEDCNVDAGDNTRSSPFQPPHCIVILGNDGDPVDDNLHEKLDFEYPEYQEEEQNG